MNLLEFCAEFAISLPKARKMLKKNVLRLDENMSDEAISIVAKLRNGDNLSALQLCALIESPSLVIDLGRYAGKAQEQLDAIGNAKAEAAPKQVAAYISEAAKGDKAEPETFSILIPWLQSVIPSVPVPHTFVGTRLLLGIAPSVRKFDAFKLSRALLECRKREEFADWWHVSRDGTKSHTLYHKPAKKPVVNFDL